MIKLLIYRLQKLVIMRLPVYNVLKTLKSNKKLNECTVSTQEFTTTTRTMKRSLNGNQVKMRTRGTVTINL